MAKSLSILLLVVLSASACGTSEAQSLQPAHGDFVIKNFPFASGEVLPALSLHYRTLGKPVRDAKGQVRNAVLIMHGTGGTGDQFEAETFGGELFVPGGSLDASHYFLIMPDAIGFGQSSKPSDGLRAKFPRYGYNDIVTAQYRLLTEGLGVNHLRLVMGTSMGAMQTWMWGERYPDFMDALLALGSLPTQISGRNRIWRRVIIDAIRNDPAWSGGNYTTQPPSLRTVQLMLFLVGSNPVLRQQMMPTLRQSDRVLDAVIAQGVEYSDANDVLYGIDASRDYDPGPALEKIRAPLFAINTADDFLDPPELGILEREIKRVPRGRAILIPFGPETRGHGTHTYAGVWKQYLVELLKVSESPRP
ncbi:MAG TPA: alpha/beta fold hydrolase [Vicinamibacterales bacterium]|nr:alpha/beta fold hydrolase [Vicinamibacterales bacterium]